MIESIFAIRRWIVLSALITVIILIGQGSHAAESEIEVKVLYLGQSYAGKKPLSLVEQIAKDGGLPGIRLAMSDNATTGAFLGHQYQLEERIFPVDEPKQNIIDAVIQSDAPFVIVDLPAELLLAVVDGTHSGAARLFFNVRDKSISLREQDCRRNVFHMIPDRAMLADALAQYLVVRRWDEWLLLVGKNANDQAFANAIEAICSLVIG